MQANFVHVRIQLMVNYVCMCMYMYVCVCIMYIDIAPHTVKSSEIQKINTCCENLNVLSFSYKVVLHFIECVSILAQQHSSPTFILLCFLSHKGKIWHTYKNDDNDHYHHEGLFKSKLPK